MLEIKTVKVVLSQNTPNEFTVFDNFSFSINKGDYISVVGSNGSGKTSLLNLISGQAPIEQGKILFKEKDISKEKEYERYRYISRVFQDTSIGNVGDFTIFENLCLAENKGKRYGFTKAIDKSKKDKYKEMLSSLDLGLEDKLETKVKFLSGGQRQALSLLMSTINKTEILLLDEHTAALDPKTADIIMKLTEKIINEKKMTALMVTHNLKNALKYGNRLIMMKNGRIILDRSGKEKEDTTLSELMELYE